MNKHFALDAAIVTHETAPRGITVCASRSPKHMHVLLHNGCGRGNMRAVMTNEEAIAVAITILKVATR